MMILPNLTVPSHLPALGLGTYICNFRALNNLRTDAAVNLSLDQAGRDHHETLQALTLPLDGNTWARLVRRWKSPLAGPRSASFDPQITQQSLEVLLAGISQSGNHAAIRRRC
jgi:hypothetical protein